MRERRLSERAFEACARADIDVFALAGDEDAVELAGELQTPARRRDRVRHARARPEPEECIGVGAALPTRRSARSG